MCDDIRTIDPALLPEVEECDRGYGVIRKTINRQPGYVVDWQLVDKAWETAKRLHCDPIREVRRKTGELYLYHPRSVMEELARLRCKSSVLAAALLHDTMEDCSVSMLNIPPSPEREWRDAVYIADIALWEITAAWGSLVHSMCHRAVFSERVSTSS